MIDLSAYSLAGLQQAAAVCRQAMAAGMQLSDLLAAIDASLPAAPQGAHTASDGHGDQPCPSCHRGHLVPWPLISREVGGLVVGCRLCMYSRMEVDDG